MPRRGPPVVRGGAVSQPAPDDNPSIGKEAPMTNAPRVWISPQAYERLTRELATLRQLSSAATHDSVEDDNSAAVRRAWRGRIQQIHDLLIRAVVGEDPPDDGVAEPG